MVNKVRIIIIAFFFTSVIQIEAQVWIPPDPPQINMQNQIWRNFRMAQIGNQIAADMAKRTNQSQRRGKTVDQKKKSKNSNPASGQSAIFPKQFSFVRNSFSPLAQRLAEAQEVKGRNDESGSQIKMGQLVNYCWGKFESSFADEHKRLGLPFNDIVSALTYFILVSHIYANNYSSIPSEHTVAVYYQLADIIKKDSQFAKLTDWDKQLLAELLVTTGGMPGIVFEKNGNNREKQSLGLANLERIFGTQASKMKITASGLEF